MTLSPVLRTAALGLTVAALSFSAAHAAPPKVVSSAPDANAGYGPWPKQIRLTFDQPLAQTGLEVSMLDPDGRRIRLGAPVRSGATVSVAPQLADTPVPGPYMLSWQANSASGEQGKGDVTFFVE